VASEPDRAELLKLYELALQEYRFQILLNWDRSKHALIFNGALLGAAAGLFRLGSGAPLLVSVIFAFVFVNSALGALGSRRGHSYYRATRAHKAAIERELGLAQRNLAIETTTGMREDHQPALRPRTRVARVARWGGRVTTYTESILWMIAATALVGVVTVLHPLL